MANSLQRRLEALERAEQAHAARLPTITVVEVRMVDGDTVTPIETLHLNSGYIDYRKLIAPLCSPDDDDAGGKGHLRRVVRPSWGSTARWRGIWWRGSRGAARWRERQASPTHPLRLPAALPDPRPKTRLKRA